MFSQPVPVQRRAKKPKKLATTGGILLLAAAVVALIGLNLHHRHIKTAVKSVTATAPVKSVFSFDATKAPDWHQGPTNQTSMVAFYNKADCFVEIDQKTGTINDTDENAKAVTTMQSQGSQNVTTTDVSLQLPTPSAGIPYTLHQYRASGGQSSYYQYEEAAYVTQRQGYLAVAGYCKNESDLNATLNALSAILFTSATSHKS